MIDTFISPNYKADKLNNPTVDDLIDVFKDRVMNWLLDPAKKLLEYESGYFGSFCLSLTYFEGIWIYITGEDSNNRSKTFFCDAFVDVFSSSAHSTELLMRVAGIMYEDGRCGFFHDGMLRNRIFLSNLNTGDLIITLPRKANGNIDINGKIESILIDPKFFLQSIEGHFIDYLLCLRNPKETIKRERFFRIARDKWDYDSSGTIIGINPDGTI